MRTSAASIASSCETRSADGSKAPAGSAPAAMSERITANSRSPNDGADWFCIALRQRPVLVAQYSSMHPP